MNKHIYIYIYIYMAARRLSLDKILQQRSHLLKSQRQVYRQTVQTSCGKRSKRLVANASNFLWQTVQMSCGNPGLIRFSYREIIHSVRKRTCKKWMPVTNFLHGLGTHCSPKNDGNWYFLPTFRDFFSSRFRDPRVQKPLSGFKKHLGSRYIGKRYKCLVANGSNVLWQTV